MSHEVVQEILDRALTDLEFRRQLLLNPDKALAGFELTPEEVAALKAIRLEESSEVTSDLETRRSKQAPSWFYWP